MDRLLTQVDSRVAILLATKNGERFLAEQLESLATQTHANWILEVSDDGSTDSTVQIIGRFAERFPGRVRIRPGPCSGFAANFLSLVLDPSIQADYYAYCDQDDIWEPHKLAHSITWLRSRETAPALYCGRTVLVDTAGTPFGKSPHFRLPPSFRNALVQNIAGGNTMAFNDVARDLMLRAGMPHVGYHDWWTYQVVTACDGEVFYDANPTVRYRQHHCNLIGSAKRTQPPLVRFRKLMEGRFRDANQRNIEALSRLEGFISERNRLVLDAFAEARTASLPRRMAALASAGIYRQTLLGNCSLAAAAILGKM